MKLNTFDSIAPYYDQLAFMFFGKSLRKSQLYFLNKIPNKANVLVLGGGTGWWLTELQSINPECRIWFIDASSEMLAIVSKRALNNVVLIHGTEHDIPSIEFDAVVTYCFLDMFDDRTFHDLEVHIRDRLKPDGVWLVSEFVDDKLWHRLVLSIMYFFFRCIGAVEVLTLNNWRKNLTQLKWESSNSCYFFGGFITSRIYRNQLKAD